MTHLPTTEPLTAQEALPLLLMGRGWPGMRIEGHLAFGEEVRSLDLPAGMEVEFLDLGHCAALQALPARLHCYELNLERTLIQELPADLRVDSILNLSNCTELRELPAGLQVGTLLLRGCQSLQALPEDLDVWFLDLTGCWGFQHWPRHAHLRSGRLNLRGCTALTALPDYLGPLAAVNLRDCPNLHELPQGLKITGWIDLAQSGIAETKVLPRSLQGVEIRWQGVRIEPRILLHPESITLEEILAEENAERRRVLLDRFGMARFIQEARAEVLDRDNDPGGARQLLRIALKDDEPLVTVSCLCPSTGRQYFLRVPPDVTTCHQAAAWIAGFERAEDYHPLIET